MSSGTCGCKGYELTERDDYKINMDGVLTSKLIGSHSEDIQRQVVDLLCSGFIIMGDQNQVSGGACTHVVHARCRTSFDQRPSLPYNAGTEAGLYLTQKTFLVPSAKCRVVLVESDEG